MRRSQRHGRPRTRLYGLLSVPLMLLAWSQVQAQTQQSAATEQDLNDLVQINVVSGHYSLSFSVGDDDKDKFTIENITCRIGSGQVIVANEQHVCENLEPCSGYTNVITLKALDAEAPTPIDQPLFAHTDYKEPKTNVTSVIATENTIEINWDTTDRACVEDFDISANAPDSSLSRQQLNFQSSYTFENALPCRTYNVTLNTRNNASISVGNETSLVNTLYLEPGEITLTVSNRSNGETRFTWTEPVHKTCIHNYTFVWRRNDCETGEETTIMTMATTESTQSTTILPDDEPQPERQECEWREQSNETIYQFTIGNLQGCALHTFEVYINDKPNQQANAVETFVSAEKLSSVVTELTPMVNATELFWVWSPPRDNAQCVAGYNVTLKGPEQHLNFKSYLIATEQTSVTFPALEPCGIYNVEIVPISLNGSAGAKLESQSTLSEDQPTEILEPTSRPEAFSIELNWEIPSYADLCIAGYRISGWMDDNKEVEALSVSTPNTSVRFDKDLLACQAYTIQIIPYTRQNLDGQLRQIEVETKAAVVNSDKILLQLAANGEASHSLALNANNQDFSNVCQTIFANFSCEAREDVPNKYGEKYVESYRENRGFQAVVSPLFPNTKYECSVLLYNVAGPSLKKTITGPATTGYFPDQPRNVTLDVINKDSLMFSWSPPRYVNGQMKYYQAFLMRYEPDYFVPSQCEAVVEIPKTDTKGDVFNTFYDLAPAVKYIMQVAAQNDFGLGQYTPPIVGITKPDVPERVTNVAYISEGPSLDHSKYTANVTIKWTMPCKSNGEIEFFELKFRGQKNGQNFEFPRRVWPDTHDPEGRMSYTETDLLPEVDYSVDVAVKARFVDTLSREANTSWRSPSGLPSRLSADVKRQMRVSAYETSHPTSSAIVRLPANILSSEAGTITYIALLLSQKSCAGDPELKFDVITEWPKVLSWNNISGDCIQQYQTTPERWVPSVNSVVGRDGGEDEITFTIGVDKCPDPNSYYCNGPLSPNTEYNMVVRLFTSSGYNDAALLEFKTDAAIKVTLILVSVCSCLFLAFVLGLVVLYVRKRIAWHRDSGQGIEDPFGNVIAKNFAIFYEEVAKPEKLAREFKEITVVALELSYAASELGCNKNRYADIYPYDKNRVILDIDTEGSDYINASFIDGHTRKKEYIATQGPKPESVMDFWRMILQHNVRVIVQVTQFREGNTIKCHEYYPYSMRGLSVTIKTKESCEIYDRTELSVVHEKYGLKEKVIHFYFKKWPDHGCPEDPMHLITFVKKVKAEKRPNYSPIVVHCSAGVGRTGTFIGLDLIMQRLKSESKINIFETVKKLRFQRMKMVQTQQQYTFLYACTYELVKHKVPRAALKLEGRPKAETTQPPPSNKKVSFPDVHSELAVRDAPDAELGCSDKLTNGIQLPLRQGGLRKTKDLDSLCEKPEVNGKLRSNIANGECAI